MASVVLQVHEIKEKIADPNTATRKNLENITVTMLIGLYRNEMKNSLSSFVKEGGDQGD